MKVNLTNQSPIILLHSVTVVLDRLLNSKQSVVSPVAASSISVINHSRLETIKVTITPSVITAGNMIYRLFPLEELEISFDTRMIKSVSVEACDNPTITTPDHELVRKQGPLLGGDTYKHYVGVRLLGERIDNPTKTCL